VAVQDRKKKEGRGKRKRREKKTSPLHLFSQTQTSKKADKGKREEKKILGPTSPYPLSPTRRWAAHGA